MKPVSMKNNCLLIDGKPIILLSSSLFYFRIPESYWEERMIQLKNCGYNTIDVYIPWNYHEIAPGQWSFTGMRDIGHFLRLAAANDLYVVARPGPYICSEWDGGALPAWLGTQPLKIRQYDKAFLSEVQKWFDKILSIISNYQYGKGGSIIFLQLENELDIYQCREPRLYLNALQKMAVKYPLHIPFVVCTSSQLDVDYSGGTAEDVYPAFNIYSAPDHPALEEKLEILWNRLEKTGNALLTTETMREHYFLKRQMIGGVRLISPYCQTASANYDCYTGISTWGNSKEKPISYMTNDYDHGAMIRSDGSVTEEYLEARLLNQLISALGEELATGRPDFQCNFRTEEDYDGKALQKIAMNLNCGGKLFCLPNLGDKEGLARIYYEETCLEVPVRGKTTLLLPFNLPLHIWNIDDVQIIWSTLEILCAELISDGCWRLILYGEGTGALLHANSVNWLIRPGEEKLIPLRNNRQLQINAVTRQEACHMSTAYLPEFRETLTGKQDSHRIDCVLAEKFNLYKPLRKDLVRYMEEYGQYNGTAVYTFDLPSASKGFLLDGASDILQIAVDGTHLPAQYGTGNKLYISQKGKTAEIRTECWGHNCGHGIGYSVIQMGSLRGIGQIFNIQEEIDLQYNWFYHVIPETNASVLRLPAREWPALIDFGDRLPLNLEEMQVYQKELTMPSTGDHRFLHIKDSSMSIHVYVNGQLTGTITDKESWLDISDATQPGEQANIVLCYSRPGMNPQAGHVFLMSGDKISHCNIGNYPVSFLQALPPAVSGKLTLPLFLTAGQIKKLTLAVAPEMNKTRLWLSFEGHGMKITVLNNSHVIGRIFVNCKMPGISVCSGDPNRVWLPEEYLNNSPQVTLLAEAMEKDALLTGILLENR